MNARTTLMGMVRMGTTEEGTCHRKSRMTSDTMIISSTSLSVTVEMARMDELRAVVGRDHLYPGRQRGFQLGQLGLHSLDDVERIFALAHDHDAADHVALPVVVGDAPPHLRAKRNRGHVLHRDRRAALGS